MENRIRIATLNLLNYVKPPFACYDMDNIYSSQQWQQKEMWLQTIMNTAKPDLIGFQEVFSPDALKVQCKKLGLDYFVCLQSPKLEFDYIFSQPPVALASRFPIVEAEALDVDAALLEKLNVSPEFNFSRSIIRAGVIIPSLGKCYIYVVHLKSKRPSLDADDIAPYENQGHSDMHYQIGREVLAQIHGSWGAALQRGTEAAILYNDIHQRLILSKDPRPIIVMGDFNDTLDSNALSPLVSGQKMRRINGEINSNFSQKTNKALQRLCLFDARELCEDHDMASASPTHYHGAQGSVIDHILLSNDFNVRNEQGLAEVASYNVFDQHLINPVYAYDSQCSDHAMVSITISLRG